MAKAWKMANETTTNNEISNDEDLQNALEPQPGASTSKENNLSEQNVDRDDTSESSGSDPEED